MKKSIGQSGFLLAFWLVATSTWAEPVADDIRHLPSFRASYDIDHRFGNGRSRTTLTVRPDGEGYVYESWLKAKGAAKLFLGETTETSRFEIVDDQLVAREWKFRDGRRFGKRNQWATFDWTTGTVEAQYKGQTTTLSIEPGTMDRHIVVLALMNDLRKGVTRDSYPIIEKSRLRVYLFENMGEEDLTTSQGAINTVKLLRRREGSDNIAHLWLAPELNYLLVRAEYYRKGKRDLVMTLNQIAWLDDEATSVAQK